MANLIKDPRALNLEDILQRRTQFRIPLFQRDYAWDTEQVDEFVGDILKLRDTSGEHFFGTVVMSENAPGDRYQGEDRVRYVIDGQQRLTTALMLLAVLRHHLFDLSEVRHENHRWTKELDDFLFLGDDSHPEEQRARISANRINQVFIDKILTSQIQSGSQVSAMFKALDTQTKKRAVKLNNAYLRMKKRIEDYSAELLGKEIQKDAKILDYAVLPIDCETVSKELRAIARRMLEKAVFVEITVNDWKDSFALFEGLNNRGLDLAKRDIIKNIVLAQANTENSNNPSALENLELRWREIEKLVPENRFTKFLRHYLLIFHKDVSLNSTVRVFLSHVSNQTAREILETIERAGTEYEKLVDPSKEQNEKVRSVLVRLRTLAAERTYPIALAVKLKGLSPSSEEKILRALEVLYFRRSAICQFDNKMIEEPVQKIASAIYSSGEEGVATAIRAIRVLNPTDSEFEEQFKLKRDMDPSITKYALLEIENSLRGHHPITATTLEHIMPQEPDRWDLSKTEKEQFDVMLNRLGNLTLLTANDNSSLGNAPFEEKRALYEREGLEINQTVISSLIWTSEQIKIRQDLLSTYICSIWNIR
jgi:uncharacterized protein with ParB-like and HNH nuclease domain